MLNLTILFTRHRMISLASSSPPNCKSCFSLFSPRKYPFHEFVPLFRSIHIPPVQDEFKAMVARRNQPDRKLLKAKDSVKDKPVSSSELSSLSADFVLEGRLALAHNQAVGLVAAAQANFMRVIVESAGLAMEESEKPKNLNPISAHHNRFLDSSKSLTTWGSVNLGKNEPGLSDSKFSSEISSDSSITKGGFGFSDLNSRDFGDGEEHEVGFRKVKDERVGTELLCVVRAVLKKIKRRVLVGDKVLVGSIDWIDGRGMIENVFKRETEIIDPPVANVDHLLVLFSMEQPKLEPFLLTRFLVEAESTGIPLTLALNKAELVEEETLFTWKERIQGWGYQPLFCSVDFKSGLTALADILKDQTTVIVGPSGVGKSSLINALRSNQHVGLAAERDYLVVQSEGSKWFEHQRVGEVSLRSGRGKHTTRNVSLLPLSGGGYFADTPGFNQPGLLKVTKKSLSQAFPEIRKMLSASELAKCTFNDCLHIGEPGCVVEGEWERYPYYLQLLDEIKIREEFQLRTLGTKRESDMRYKVGDMGVKQAEPRLELKKHRRQSRKRLNQSILDDLDDLDEDDGLVNIEEDAL